MGSQWRPSPEEQKALKLAYWRTGYPADWAWRDDLMQAGRIHLWRTSERRRLAQPADPVALALTYAQRAMWREWRRVMQRWRDTSPAVETVPFEDWHGVDNDTPEHAAQRSQSLRRAAALPEPYRQALEARLQHDTQREAAQALGLTREGFATRLGRATAALRAGV